MRLDMAATDSANYAHNLTRTYFVYILCSLKMPVIAQLLIINKLVETRLSPSTTLPFYMQLRHRGKLGVETALNGATC